MAARKTMKSQSTSKQNHRAASNGLGNNSGPHDDSPIKASAAAVSNGHPTLEDVRLRAYEIFVARGGSHGDDLADWLAAESELMAPSGRK